MIDHAAMAVAARACGCRAVADEIEAKHLTAEGVARLFRLSARRDRGHIAAIVILAGVAARFSLDRQGFQDHGERELVLALIAPWQFAEADRQALRLVRAHWGEIAKEQFHGAEFEKAEPATIGCV
jgi:hypothetical protein